MAQDTQTVLEALKARAPKRSVLEEIRARAQEPTMGERLLGGALSAAQGGLDPLLRTLADTPTQIAQTLIPGRRPEESILGGRAARIRSGLATAMPQSVVNEEPGAARFATTTMPSALASTGGFLLAGGGLGMAGAALVGALTNGSAAYHEAKASGADEKTSWTAWALSAGVGTSEALPLGRILQRYAGGKAGSVVGSALLSATEEGAQEFVQQVGTNLAASATFDEDRKALEGIAEASGAGGLSGFILSLVGSAVGARRARPQADQMAGRPEESAENLGISESTPAEAVPLEQVGQSAAPPELTTEPSPSPALDPQTTPATVEGLSTPVETLSTQAAAPAPEQSPQAEPTLLEAIKQNAATAEVEQERTTDELLADKDIRSTLEGLAGEAGWSDVGGLSITTGRLGGDEYLGRTHWVPKAEWWVDRPAGMTEKSVKTLVAKVLKDPTARLGEKQRSQLDWLLRHAQNEQLEASGESRRERFERERDEQIRQYLASSREQASSADPLLERFKSANKAEKLTTVEPSTPAQKYAAEFLKQRGAELTLVDAGRKLPLPGVYGKGRVILDAQRGGELKALAFHEITHRLAAQSPDSYRGLFAELAQADPQGLKALGEQYRQRFEKATGERLTPDELAEEATAFYAESIPSYLEQAFEKPERLARIAEHNPGLVRRMLDQLVRLLRKIKVGMGLTTSQEKALRALKSELASTGFEKQLPPEVALKAAQTIARAVNELRESESVSEAEETPFAADDMPAQESKYKPGNPFAAKALAARAKADRLNRPTAHEQGMANAFPLGAGFGHGSQRSRNRKIESSVNRAVEAVEAAKNAAYLEAQAEAFDAGRINAQGRRIDAASRARSEKREAYQATREERVAQAKAQLEGKERWQVPREVYADSTNNMGGGARRLMYEDHRRYVEEALAAGQSVPPEVLADYPDLVPADKPPQMPKGRVIGKTITGEDVHEKTERGDLKRPGEGLKKPKATQLGAFDEQGGLFERQAEERDRGSMFAAAQDDLGFFSQLENVLDQKLPSRASSKQVLDVARSGSKSEEIEWSGLEEWLKDKPSVKKQDVLAFLRENNVRVEEVVHGGRKPGRGGNIERLQNGRYLLSTPGGTRESFETLEEAEAEQARLADVFGTETTKFHSYQLPGGKNYQEVLLTLPAIAPMQSFPDFLRSKGIDPETWKGTSESPEFIEHEKARDRDYERRQRQFQSGHFDEPNVLAHVRLNERTDSEGRRTLFLEEIQSDWHQKGRREGYRSRASMADLAAAEAALAEAKPAAEAMVREARQQLNLAGISMSYDQIRSASRLGVWSERAPFSAEFKQSLEEMMARVDTARNRLEDLKRGGEGVPDAPFKSTWHELALKRMVRLAAEKGYDSLAWTTGEQQAARYDLSKHVEEIKLYRDHQGAEKVGYIAKGGGSTGDLIPVEAGRRLEDIIGKEAAERLSAQEWTPSRAGNGWTEKRLAGLDLKVGGEGMRGFYDKMLVASANKIGKRFGSKVERVETRTSETSDYEVRNASGEMEYFTTDPFRARASAQQMGGSVREIFKSKPVHSLPITEEMRASVMREGFPRFAAAGPEGEQGFDVPEETASRRFYRGMVADFDRLEQLEKAAPVKAEGESLKESLSLYPGRRFGEGEKLDTQVVRPIKRLLKRSKIPVFESTDERVSASDFLYALHAPERNALIAERNPDKFGTESNPGSGMSDSDAKALVAKALKSDQAAEYQKLQEINRALNVRRLDILEKGGLLSADQRAEWEKFGPDFVPLRTATDPMEKLFPSGSLSIRGKESKRAMGRSSKADSPLVFALSRTQEALERAERNRVGQKLAEIVRANPSELWRVGSDLNTKQENEETLSFKENGEQSYIFTSDEGAAKAFKRIQDPDPGVLRVVDPLLSYLHDVIIRFNPVFPLTNMPRDVGMATIKSLIRGEPGAAFGVLKSALPAAKGAFRAIKSEDAKGKWEGVYRRARDAGALIGWSQQYSFEERAKDFEKAVSRTSKARAFGQLMDAWNRSTELGTRLAVFDAMLRAGKTESEAAMLTRRVTADFARRGSWAPVYRRLYLFSGANVQGTAEMLETIAQNPRRASLVLGSLVAAGFGLAAASMSWGDDEEREKLTEEEKARFMGVMVGKKRYGVAAPYGFNAFLYAGWKMAEVLLEGEDEGEAAVNVLKATIDTMSPLPRGATLGQSLVPTLARPFAEVEQNRDFANRPIMPDVDPFDPSPPPDVDRFFRGVSPISKGITEGLYAGSGEAIDVSPETIDHLAKAATGGLGTFMGRSSENLRKLAAGETDWARPDEWPIVGPATRAFVQVPMRGAEARLYYELRTKIDEANDRSKKGRSLSDEQKRLLAIRPSLLATERVLRKLREARKTADEKQAAELDAKILENQKLLLSLVSKARSGSTQKP